MGKTSSANAMERAQAELAKAREEAARDVPPGIEQTEPPRGVAAKLSFVQSHLCAPKSKFNKFGGYNYRSAEDILTAVKPLLREAGAVIVITDALRETPHGEYIEASARMIDIDTGESVTVTAYAREPESKKGMDASQITGAASSYARKYALNGLLLIDDSADADALPPTQQKAESGAIDF